MNRRQSLFRSGQWCLAIRRCLVQTLAMLFLLGIVAESARAEHHGDSGPDQPLSHHTQKKSHEDKDEMRTGMSSAAASDNHSNGQPVNMKNRSVTKTASAAASVLPPVPDTDLSQVPPVPINPFVAVPVAAAPPSPANASSQPASKPLTVGLGANGVYEVYCVVAGGDYCSFTNSYYVAPGSTCHCGSAAGTTE